MPMTVIDSLILKTRRGDSAFFRLLRGIARMLVRPRAPRFPAFFKPVLRFFYELHFACIRIARLLITVLYRHPLFQGRCATIGKNVSLDGLPFIDGHLDIHVGDDVWLGGRMSISSGRFLERPQLVIKDRAELSWNLAITVNREVVIEEDVKISYDCRISDSDAHPRESDLRAQKASINPKDIRAVRICKHAWIGNGTHIMKGVTIGEGAIIGANSVVMSNVPPYSLAFGNPAEVYFKNYGRPSKKPAPPASGDGSSKVD